MDSSAWGLSDGLGKEGAAGCNCAPIPPPPVDNPQPTPEPVLMKYRTIVVDPPWPTTTGPHLATSGWGHAGPDNGHKRLAYPTMSLDEIRALKVGEWADDAAHVYLWTTNILVRTAYDILAGWGFKPSVLLTWCKTPMGSGLGDAFGITTEHILFGHRGGLRPKTRVPSTWWHWKRGRHSQKPEAFQDIVESVSPGPYLEMFARRHRLGWDVWGNEVSQARSP